MSVAITDGSAEKYLAFGRALNPNRIYTLVEAGDIAKSIPVDSPAFADAVRNQLKHDLGSNSTPELEARFISEARGIAKGSPGNAATEIFALPGGKEAAMIYPGAAPSKMEVLKLFTGYSENAIQRLGLMHSITNEDMRNLKALTRYHEFGHGTDPTRNQGNTRDYLPGRNGLYDANSAETRADIIAVMQSMRDTGSTRTAQIFSDLMVVKAFNESGRPDQDDQVMPGMQHYAAPVIQRLIDHAAENNYYRNMKPREMAAYADNLAADGNARLKQDNGLEKFGGILRDWNAQLYGVPEEKRLQQAVKMGLTDPAPGFTQKVVQAHKRLSAGQPVEPPVVVPKQEPGQPVLPPAQQPPPVVSHRFSERWSAPPVIVVDQVRTASTINWSELLVAAENHDLRTGVLTFRHLANGGEPTPAQTTLLKEMGQHYAKAHGHTNVSDGGYLEYGRRQAAEIVKAVDTLDRTQKNGEWLSKNLDAWSQEMLKSAASDPEGDGAHSHVQSTQGGLGPLPFVIPPDDNGRRRDRLAAVLAQAPGGDLPATKIEHSTELPTPPLPSNSPEDQARFRTLVDAQNNSGAGSNATAGGDDKKIAEKGVLRIKPLQPRTF